MLCDELKAEQWLDYSGEPMPCYPKAKVDAALAAAFTVGAYVVGLLICIKRYVYG